MHIKKIITFVCISLFLMNGTNDVMAAPPVQTLQTNLAIPTEKQPATQRITPTDQTLYGQNNTFQYNYSLTKDQQPSKANVLHLKWNHSELLIAPSSLTISIDGQPVKSVPISDKTKDSQLTIPLQKNHLTKGNHTVDIQFYGVIKEGVCVNQNTTGNWFNIKPASYLRVENEMTPLTLAEFPQPFVHTAEQPTVIVIPTNPSAEEVKAGLLLKNNLQSIASNTDNVLIQQENRIRQWTGNYIFVGTYDSWGNTVKKLVDQSKLKAKKDTLHVQRIQLANGKTKTEGMFVLADTENTLVDKLPVLSHPDLHSQLSGNSMEITNTPKTATRSNNVSFKQMGAQDLYLSGHAPKSPHYYYPVPAFEEGSSLTLKLKFKTSSLAQVKEELTTNAELIVWVNDVPHPITLNNLKETNQTWIEKELKVDSSVVKNNSFLDMYMEVTGLKEDVACIQTDERKWVFVSADSQWILPQMNEQLNNQVFTNWSSAFRSNNSGTVIVPNQIDDRTLQELNLITSSIPNALSTQNFHIVKEEDVNEKILKDNSLLFLGGPDEHEYLNKVQEQLLIPYENGKIDIASQGFVQETSNQVAWIQPSIWNEENALIVLDNINPKSNFTDKTLLTTISSPEEPFSIAVKNQNGKVFTNSQSIELPHTKESNDTQLKNQQTSWLYIVGFMSLIIIIGAILLRKRRKKE
ncbi:cellulose biosynthesis cyclic di-GMP-binding regulatory protein BcsB [Bacillus sp. Hm123]|uniref:cellulose biosynthesis cyclic di-GMP-binding regulatory protein BcsB n=1 Tax=Bacillus sp. Hm123 TaxID=3450745 RepID=UPI003F436BA2